MKKFPPISLITLCAAGIFLGLAARRLTSPSPETPHPVAQTPSKPAPKNGTPVTEISRNHSTDTVGTLAALEPQALYSRLALWLLDASQPGISAFWTASQKSEHSMDIKRLILLHWTRLNPQAAIAAAASTGDEEHAWWAWACHDPRSALAAARGSQVEAVAQGIGEFHPQWLRQHFQELPKIAQTAAIRGMGNRADGEHPLETLQFIRDHGGSISDNPENFKALARQDPWVALEWATKEYASSRNDPFASAAVSVEIVLETLASERPEDLKRIIAGTPSGELKLEMESKLFANLIKTDPAAALEQAKTAPAPRIAAERYAALGQSVVRSDPEQAFQLAKDLFTACPDALRLPSQIEFPDGRRQVSSTDVPGVEDFMSSLMAKDPSRLMDMVLQISHHATDQETYHPYLEEWARQDLDAFTTWRNQQTDQTALDAGAAVISKELQGNGNFAEAMDWELSRFSAEPGELEGVISDWLQADPDAPARWLESSDLPADRRAVIQSILNEAR